jgi:hypothetical protein
MDQLRDHTGKKRKYWLALKEVMRAAPRLFCVRWHDFGLPLPSFSRWVLSSNH